MSAFVLLFRNPRAISPPAAAALQVPKWAAWITSLGIAGHLKDPGHPLAGKGKVVKGMKKVVTDGPFGRQDILGGFMVIDAKDFDHAMAIAMNCPVLETGGSVEIRPVAATP